MTNSGFVVGTLVHTDKDSGYQSGRLNFNKTCALQV